MLEAHNVDAAMIERLMGGNAADLFRLQVLGRLTRVAHSPCNVSWELWRSAAALVSMMSPVGAGNSTVATHAPKPSRQRLAIPALLGPEIRSTPTVSSARGATATPALSVMERPAPVPV